MSTTKRTVIGEDLPNIPWEDKPADCIDVVWREVIDFVKANSL